jgi:uncharacterized protein DUF5681
MPFAPGQSGNPGGRPPGARNKATIAREALLGEGGEVVARKLRELAERGHVFAVHALLDRAVLARRMRRGQVPRTETAAGTGAAAALVLVGLAKGSLTSTTAAQLLGLGAGPLQTAAGNNRERTEPACAAVGKNGGESADPL